MAEDIEGLLRQVLAGQAGAASKMESLEGWITSVAADTKEARDGVVGLTATVASQDLPGRIAEVRAEARVAVSELRGDVVHQNTKLREEIQAVDAQLGEEIEHIDAKLYAQILAVDNRLKDLERLRHRAEGARSLLDWFAKHWPGLVAILAAGLAAVGLDRGKLGG